ncbi:MAG: PAS domain-containing protein, partial [Dehalococcoidales bacterium]
MDAQEYKDLCDSSNDLMQSVTPDGRFRYVNNTWRQVLGYSPREVAAMTIWDIIYPDELEHCQELFRRVMSGEDVGLVTTTFVTRDGRKIFVEGNINCHFTDGKPVYTRAIFRDITQHKQAEERLQQAEENLKAYLESAPDGIYISDLKGTFLYGNKKAEEIMGYKREELIGKSFLKLKILPARDLAKAGKLLALNAMGKPTGPDEFELVRKDRSRVSVEINTTPIKQEGKTVVIGLVRDITERKRAEDTLRESEERYRALLELSGEVGEAVVMLQDTDDKKAV